MDTPNYFPKRRHTLLGFPAYKDDLVKVEQALRDCIPIKYEVTIKNKVGAILSGSIVTHLEIEDYLLWKNYTLISMDGDPDMALSSERTTLL
jgi:hypothetical protein